MLRVGCVLLSVWTVPNLLLAVGIVVALVVFEQHAPALTILFSDAERDALASIALSAGNAASHDARLLSTVDALAVLANAVIASFCALALFLTWRDVRHAQRPSLAVVAATTLFVQVAGFASDGKLGNANLIANSVSTCVLLLGLCLCVLGARQQVRVR